MIGYCFANVRDGEVAVLVIRPEFEGCGLGRRLLSRTVETLADAGFDQPFLLCSSDPGVRSHGFYRHLGWKPTGKRDEHGDEILEFEVHSDQ